MSQETILQEICEVGRAIHRQGFVAANSGNISVRLEDGSVWVTPTGVSKGDITPDSLVHIDLEGRRLEPGPGEASSETKMHLAAYRADPEIRAVVHTHSRAATYLSMFGEELSDPISADIILQVGNIPVAPYAELGTQELAEGIGALAPEYHAALLQNHGVVVFGRTLREAYYRAEAVENYCALLCLCRMGKREPRRLTRQEVAALLAKRWTMPQGHKGGVPKTEKNGAQTERSNEEFQ